MKRVLCFLVVFFSILLNAGNIQAKDKSCVRGSFRFTYKLEKDSIWLKKITPLSSKGISELIIPERLEGKKVTRLGARNSDNIFGVCRWEEDYSKLIPSNIVKPMSFS